MAKIIPQKFKKLGMCTDIHFGRRNNSRVHNQDCVDFLEWFADNIRQAGDYSHICFLGDWFESRSAINIDTMEYSYRGLQILNDIGLPIYFVVGNHDLHKRTTRDVHSVRMFNEMSNFKVIDRVTVEVTVLTILVRT
jgi:DNA repair exonuclease SbcCD nuclease subunit